MSPLELVELYISRVTRTCDVTALESLQWRGLGAIHALYASGLLTDVENNAALNLFIDTCSTRRAELAGAPNDSEGDAQ